MIHEHSTQKAGGKDNQHFVHFRKLMLHKHVVEVTVCLTELVVQLHAHLDGHRCDSGGSNGVQYKRTEKGRRPKVLYQWEYGRLHLLI